MRTINFYITEANGDKEKAFDLLEQDCIEDIADELMNMDDYELFEIINWFNSSVHSMDELDDVFDNLTPTEILQGALDGIDTYDSYFNEDNCVSSNDLWEIADVSPTDLARQIFNSDYDDSYSIGEIASEYRELYDDLEYFINEEEKKEKKIEIARALFEKMVTENVDETISKLWN